MAYVRPGSMANTPLGSEDADTIDDIIREKMEDIEERLSTIMGTDGDITDDPIIDAAYSLTALHSKVAEATSIQRNVGWYAGSTIVEVGTITKAQTSIRATGANGEFHCIIPVVLPPGVTITAVRVRMRRNSGSHTADMSFQGISDDSTPLNQSITAPSPQVSPHWAEATGMTHTVIANQHYAFNLRFDNNNADTSVELTLYYCQVVYTNPGGNI